MRALGRKGAAATKRRYADDPAYFKSIGKRGGLASGASRRAKLATRTEKEPQRAEPGGPLRTIARKPSNSFESR